MRVSKVLTLASFISVCSYSEAKSNETDPNGYIVFCPCMGRFGNQVDQFLGVLAFAKALDRTLVLPNFIEFKHPETKMIPFEFLFQVGTVAKYTRVVTMQEFTKKIMPTHFVGTPRQAIYDKSAEPGCHSKEGNPFGPYWDQIDVSFVGDEYFGDIPGGFDLNQMGSRKKWLEKFPSEEYPVLAFSSAPAPFPSKGKVWSIQKYLRWSSRITEQAKKFISANLAKPFVAVHLRNDADWVRVCEHIDTTTNRPLFASEQCLGEGHHLGTLTKEICSPSKQQILEQIVEKVGSIGAKSVFVASDKDHMIDEINEALKPYEIEAHRQEPDDMYTSLAIMGRADLFVGNCVSTFSHIVKRERDHAGQSPRPSAFFGIRAVKRHIDL
uniref:GDP-fucose protein O-fucosyltransferase 1 n=1 Tax=Caenorhabditis elegans TaxID=6239 RepID=Q00P41_CAEEL|nr:putative protein O-fucosyltransferase 1 [Caenorhabditis elegans]